MIGGNQPVRYVRGFQFSKTMAIVTALTSLFLSAPAFSKPPVVGFSSKMEMSAVYDTVNANVIRCYADGEFVLAQYAGSKIQAPKIVINGRWGHRFSIIDFIPVENGTTVAVKLIYGLGRGRRSTEWRRALEEWLVEDRHDFCPFLP